MVSRIIELLTALLTALGLVWPLPPPVVPAQVPLGIWRNAGGEDRLTLYADYGRIGPELVCGGELHTPPIPIARDGTFAVQGHRTLTGGPAPPPGTPVPYAISGWTDGYHLTLAGAGNRPEHLTRATTIAPTLVEPPPCP